MTQGQFFQAAPLPVGPLGDRERLACLRLIRSENIGPATFRALINRFGGAERALDAVPALSVKGGRSRPIRICSREEALRELDGAACVGAAPLFTIEPGYPARLAVTDGAPPLIYVKGRVGLLAAPSVAIVGSRQCSTAGQKLARIFAAGIGHAGYAIVSGLARGVDGAAHEASLETGTIAVVAGGVDIAYPPEHERLQRAIAEQGCLVSEQPAGFSPRGQDFPRRNRIISGLSLGVVVIEAARRSGSLVTARRAADQGREVFAVPGHPLDPRAEGTNALLKSGATIATEPCDVINALQPLSGVHIPSGQHDAPLTEPVTETFSSPAEASDGERAEVLSALGQTPVDIDSIARSCKIPARLVQAIVMEFDLAGYIERHGAQLISLKQRATEEPQ